jgi:hypothetical protein
MKVRAGGSEKECMKCLDYLQGARGFFQRAKESRATGSYKNGSGDFSVLLASDSWALGSDVIISSSMRYF